MSRYARRIDLNHTEILACLQSLGARVHSTAALGGGFPDLVVQRHGQTWLVEVKDGRKSRSRRALTSLELDFASRFDVFLVECPEDAAQLLRGMREPIKGVPLAMQGKGVRHG